MKPHKNEQGKFDAFTSLGCYPLFYMTADDGVLCPDCANRENGSKAAFYHRDKQWRLTHVDIYWEGAPMFCEHCNGEIESAYGDPEAESEADDA